MTWTGVSEASAAFDRVMRQIDIASGQFVREASTMVISEAQKNFVGSHRRGTKRPPGAPAGKPMVVTGALRRSIVMDRMSGLGNHVQGVRVGPTMIYARSVELKYGYKFFGPAVTMVRPRIQSLAKSIFARAF
jgi:hypothetical protein